MNKIYLAQKINIGGQEIEGPLKNINNLAELTNTIISFLIPIAAVILLFVLISGGYDYLMSQGESTKLKTANAKLTAGIIGFALLVFSYFIVKLIALVFGLQGGLF